MTASVTVNMTVDSFLVPYAAFVAIEAERQVAFVAAAVAEFAVVGIETIVGLIAAAAATATVAIAAAAAICCCCCHCCCSHCYCCRCFCCWLCCCCHSRLGDCYSATGICCVTRVGDR